MTAQIWAGVEHTDCASLSHDGVHCRCYVWRDAARHAVEAAVYVEQQAGQEVLLHRETLFVTEGTDGQEGPLSWGADSPKVIAVGPDFVCHYLDADEPEASSYTLHRSTLSIDGASLAWNYRGSIPTGGFWLHDLQPAPGSTTDYVYTHSTPTTDRISIVRANGLDWVDTAWSVNHDQPHVARVLCCYAHPADGDVAIAFQGDANDLYCRRFNWSNGGGGAGGLAITTWGDAEYTQAAFCRYQANSIVLLTESINLDSGADVAFVPAVVYVGLSSTTGAPLSDEHSCYHLRLLSRPWSYASAREDSLEPNVYAALGYNNVRTGEFDQRNAYVVNLGRAEWGFGGDDHVFRPRICSNLNQGTLDTRSSGYSPADVVEFSPIPGFATQRRMNHVSNASLPPPYGPYRATRTCALLGFAKLISMSSADDPQLQPVGATLLSVVAHMEEPWTVRRDAQDPSPAAPSQNFLGAYPWTVGQGVEVGRTLLIGGGSPAVFDGYQLVENGYPWVPEILAVADLGAGETLPAGELAYCATYEWRDGQGQLHRSAPSTVWPHTHEIGAVVVDVSTMTVSQRDNAYWYPACNPIEVVLWRAGADGIFRRVHGIYLPASPYQIRNLPANDPSTWMVECIDEVAPDALALHEILPWQLLAGGGWTPLPPYCPPAFTTICKWQNRVWGASSEDPRVLWYSQEVLPEPGGVNSLPPEWNPTLTYRVDEVGRITALCPMDSTLVVFTDRGIFFLTGFGADSTGQNPSLQLQTISTGTGCIEPRSVVLTAIGVFFQTLRGLYLLTRTGSLEHLDFGAAAEDVVSTGGNLRSATLLEDRHEVRWVTNSAVTGGPLVLLYDYQHDVWSTAPLPLGASNWMSSGAGGTLWRGTAGDTLHVVLEQGALLLERPPTDATPYVDTDRNSDDPIFLDVTTERIAVDGIAGFQRIKLIGIVLDKPTASAVNVQLWYDVDGGVAELTETISFASPAGAYLRVKPRHQKCTAFRIRIYETVGSPATENLQITGIHLEVGIKKGTRKAG
jgi:hypothetical protein